MKMNFFTVNKFINIQNYQFKEVTLDHLLNSAPKLLNECLIKLYWQYGKWSGKFFEDLYDVIILTNVEPMT